MNIKYAIILAFGLSSTVAVMSQSAPLTEEDIDSPSENAIVLPMEEAKVSVIYDPKNSVSFTDEGVKGTSDGLTLDLGEIDFGSGDYSSIWVEMANIMKPTGQTGFDFYLDDMLLEPKTDFKIAQELPHLDSYESDKQPQTGLFFKNKNVPLNQISVFNVSGDDSYGKITAAVAQGVLNQSNAEVYLVYEGHHQTQFEDVYGKQGETWNLLRGDYSKEKYAGLATLVDKYKDRFKKMVLWDPDKEWTWCLAQMICAQQKGIPVTKEIKDFFNNELNWNIECEDSTGKWAPKLEAYQWAIDNLAEGCHKTLSFSAGLRSDYITNPWKIYDYAVASKGFVFFLKDSEPDEFAMIQKICKKMNYQPGSSTMGYGAGKDGDALNNATNPHNVGFMVSDYYANGSFWCSFPRKAFQQRKGQAVEALPGKIYVSLIWSDGDNVQFDSNQMYNMFKNARCRGKVPVGMTMAASLQELNPVLLEYFYKNLTPNDELVAGPSGFQFIYGDKYNENNYEKWLDINQKWMDTAGFHTACLWNTTNKERFGRYMKTCGLQGVFDGFENNKERYEVGKDDEGIVCILQGAHCWEEGDVYKDLISVKPNGQKPVFRNVYLIAANYGGAEGYERLIRELQRVESYLPNTYEFLLPMDLCATLKEYIEKNGGGKHE
ncbi:GxGYxYP domain-containing protein [Bacteroides nordii]